MIDFRRVLISNSDDWYCRTWNSQWFCSSATGKKKAMKGSGDIHTVDRTWKIEPRRSLHGLFLTFFSYIWSFLGKCCIFHGIHMYTWSIWGGLGLKLGDWTTVLAVHEENKLSINGFRVQGIRHTPFSGTKPVLELDERNKKTRVRPLTNQNSRGFKRYKLRISSVFINVYPPEKDAFILLQRQMCKFHGMLRRPRNVAEGRQAPSYRTSNAATQLGSHHPGHKRWLSPGKCGAQLVSHIGAEHKT